MKNESEMLVRFSFSTFWNQRNLGDSLFLDRITANNASVLIAFVAYKLGVTPNQLSVATGISSLFAFCAAVTLPPDQTIPSMVTVYLLSQVSYLFDCADGQLARATGRASDFGDFLDKGIDIASSSLSFGAFFAYAYKNFTHHGYVELADYFLLIGFLFILVRTSRFFVWQNFIKSLPQTYHSTKIRDSAFKSVILNLMDHQFSLFNMLIFLLYPLACLCIFAGQAVILGAAYINYFRRAWPSR
jgi:phosphatidylglycerophosphate synthase